ncbi:MAG: ABC transporter ATP-binding protein, partial [Akkermansiaceae bacterium]|nr:ABC transporter ATP-binding protein [Akkermansiaceae bacterium]
MNLTKGLGIGYGSLLAEVTEDISLEVGTHYLLARNGRGKTTLL